MELLYKLHSGAGAALRSGRHLERTQKIDRVHERRRGQRAGRDGRKQLKVGHWQKARCAGGGGSIFQILVCQKVYENKIMMINNTFTQKQYSSTNIQKHQHYPRPHITY